jgi:hypothetical protein
LVTLPLIILACVFELPTVLPVISMVPVMCTLYMKSDKDPHAESQRKAIGLGIIVLVALTLGPLDLARKHTIFVHLLDAAIFFWSVVVVVLYMRMAAYESRMLTNQ